MSPISQPTDYLNAGSRLDLTAATVLVGVISFAAAGLYLQFNTHLNHDLAWILYSADWLLNGARFGYDVIEPNPPLVWWLTYPALLVGEALGIHPATSYRLEVAFLAAGALGLCNSVLAGRSETSHGYRAVFALLAAYWLFIGCYRDFGQREYLALALALPYLLVCASRVGDHRVSPWQAVVAGTAAGIGLSLKPYFLAVFVLAELVILIGTRRFIALVRYESSTLVAAVLAYVIAILIWAPDYLEYAVPLISPIYFGFANSMTDVLWRIWLPLLGVATLLFWALRGRLYATESVLTAAAVGFLISYVIQTKGYSYHAFPIYALVSLALALTAVREFRRSAGGGWEARLASWLFTAVVTAILTLNATTVVAWYQYINSKDGPFGKLTDALIRVVESNAENGRFLALSTHPFPGFPIALYTTADWVSRANSLFFLPAVAKLRDAGNAAQPELLRYAEDQARAFLIRDLSLQPDIVLLDAGLRHHGISGEFDILAFYLEDPTLRQLWSDYREAEAVSGIRIFIRDRVQDGR